MSSQPKRAKTWHVPMSSKAQRTTNPIRSIVDKIMMQKREPIPGKPMIPLSLGDPCSFGNLNAPDVMTEAVVKIIQEKKHNGYGASPGINSAREAIAQKFSTPNCKYKMDDIIIGSGCSGALEIALCGLLDDGDNVLVPRPGFPLYQVLAESHGAHVKQYDLLPEKNWQADPAQVEALIDGRTRGIMILNPSNPCGSVYPKQHLLDLIAIAERHRLPIIADEIYGELVFDGFEFFAIAELSTSVPVVTVGGLAKQYVVPGWRVGWLMIYDPVGCLEQLREGYGRLTQLIVGTNTAIQACIPAVLTPAPGSAEAESLRAATKEYLGTLQANAFFTHERLSKVRGLRTVQPQGAMYVMVGFDPSTLKGIKDDADFSDKLLSEEAVFVLPGQCFGIANFFRVVYCAPHEKLAEAYDRIDAFCQRHSAA